MNNHTVGKGLHGDLQIQPLYLVLLLGDMFDFIVFNIFLT